MYVSLERAREIWQKRAKINWHADAILTQGQPICFTSETSNTLYSLTNECQREREREIDREKE